MNTLAFDTCFGACSVAAFWREGERRSAHRFELLGRGHAERLLPMISSVMEEAPFEMPALERIVVTTGPGTFTGQRVGIAAARALALATGAEVATLSSLEVMAHTAVHALGSGALDKTIAVAVDARRGEIYFQSFSGSDMTPLGPPSLEKPEDVFHRFAGREVIVVGSGAESVAAAAGSRASLIAARLPSLEPDVVYIPDRAMRISDTAPKPLYLRPADAKPQFGSIERAS